jgi:beta-lactamase regulating signal transducer with metallopeptidase domain
MAVSLVIKVTLVIAAAAIVQATLGRRASAATRHLAWAGTVALLLALPVLNLSVPHWYVEVPGPDAPAAISRSVSEAQPLTTDRPTRLAAAGATVTEPNSVAATDERSTSWIGDRLLDWSTLAVTIWAFGTLLLLVRLSVERRYASRMAADAVAVTDQSWLRLFAEGHSLLRLRGAVQLLQTTEATMPMAVRANGTAILLPVAANAWPIARRRAVLFHEMAHVARYDLQTQAFAALACAFYWPHPGIWWIARRMRIERELACDDRVIVTGTDPRDYAEHLLEIAYTLNRFRAPGVAVTMAGAGQLETRMLAVLDAARNRALPAARTCAAAAAVSAAAIASLASIEARVVPGEPVVTAAISPNTAPAIMPQPVARGPAADGRRLAPEDSGQVRRLIDRDAVPPPGAWSIRVVDSDRVQLTINEGTSTWSRPMSRDELAEFDAQRLWQADAPITVRVRRDAGTFTFEGMMRAGAGGGTFTFAPDRSFADVLARRGMQRPSDRELSRLAMANAGTALLDELRQQGYQSPSLADFIRAADHGVDRPYVREMAAAGYKVGTLDALIRMRDHGVTPEFIRGLVTLGFGNQPPDELVRTRDHGVTPEYIREMRALGLRSSSLGEFIRLRDHGVGAEYAQQLARAGYRDIPVDELVILRDHGVTVEYIEELSRLGYRAASLRDLVTARDHGVMTEYARAFRDLGYTTLDLDDLRALRDAGVTADRVRAANRRAGTRLGPLELQRLAHRGWRD